MYLKLRFSVPSQGPALSLTSPLKWKTQDTDDMEVTTPDQLQEAAICRLREAWKRAGVWRAGAWATASRMAGGLISVHEAILLCFCFGGPNRRYIVKNDSFVASNSNQIQPTSGNLF